MPFAPSSPVRLYATRKSRASSTAESSPTQATSKLSGIKKLRNSFSSTSPRTATNSNSSMSANEDGNRLSLSKENLAAETIDMDEQSRDRDFQGAGRTISIQEALATIAITRDATIQESSAIIRPQSTLFDNASDSEYSIEEDITPVIGRASSVRVSKPRIVENKPSKTLKFQIKRSSHAKSDSQSSLKAGHVSGSQSEMLPTMLEESVQQYSGQTIRPVTSEDSDDLSLRIDSKVTETEGSSSSASADTKELDRELILSVAAYDSTLPTGSTLYSIHPRIIQSSITDVDEPEVSTIQKSEREMSATLPSPGKGLSRRVQIRPSDLVTKNHHNQLSFRETVVTTPYPSRLPDETASIGFDGIEREGSDDESSGRNGRREKQKQRLSPPNTAREKDRFPSPERPEVLFLDLNLHNHPDARTTLEIEVAEKTTFDDEALFQQIKAAYQKQLLNGPRRIFNLVRKATRVTVTGSSQSSHSYRSSFNGAEFLQHIHNPRIGRRRKVWILWLRNQNASLTSTQNRKSASRLRHIDNLTRLSTLARHSRHSSQNTKSSPTEHDENKYLSTASDASSFYFAYSPMISKLPFLTARHENRNLRSKKHLSTDTFDQPEKSPCRSFFWPSTVVPTPDCESLQRLTITIHHSFRLTTVAGLTLLNILFAVLCAVMWVVFGVPGTHPGSDTQKQIDVGDETITVATDWRVNSQGRVLTGVVIGLVVLVLGSLSEGLLLWMVWLLL